MQAVVWFTRITYTRYIVASQGLCKLSFGSPALRTHGILSSPEARVVLKSQGFSLACWISWILRVFKAHIWFGW